MSGEDMNHEVPSPESANGGDDAQGVEAVRREAEENWNKYLRTAAELDNLRKRSAREIEAARKFGAERLAQAILPVRDSIEAALATGERADLKTVLEGEHAMLRLLDQAFASAGITEIDPHGEPFDPAKHEALSLVPAPQLEPNTVLEVVQKGFRLHERLVRADKVIVARGES